MKARNIPSGNAKIMRKYVIVEMSFYVVLSCLEKVECFSLSIHARDTRRCGGK